MSKAKGALHCRHSLHSAILVLVFLVFTFSLLNAITLDAQDVADSWRLPLDGEWFDPRYLVFGYWRPGWGGYHLGDDVWRDYEAEVYAAAKGKVVHRRCTRRMACVVVIEHNLPDGDYCSVYWHLRPEGLIEKDDDVEKGEPIGYLADVKKYPAIQTTHLHFEIVSGPYDPENPRKFTKGYGSKEDVDLRYSPYHFITSDNLLIDEYTPFFEKSPSKGWRRILKGYSGRAYHAFANNDNVPTHLGTWNLNSIRNYKEGRFKAGKYEVWVYIPAGKNKTSNAKYAIYHDGKLNYFTIDQSLYFNEWVSLGTFYFSGKGDEYVRLDNNTGEPRSLRRMVVYDAIKFEYRPVSSWAKAYGGAGGDYAYSIQQTTDGGYIVAGATNSFGAGSSDFWVLKLDSNGDIPDCPIIGESNAIMNDTNAIVTDTNVTGIDTNVIPLESAATGSDTNTIVTEVCTY